MGDSIKTQNLLILLGWLVCGSLVDCARILAVLPVFAPSHHRVFHPILKTLAGAGHELVVYSPFPLENPPRNYTNVYIENDLMTEELIAEMVQYTGNQPNWKCTDLLTYRKIVQIYFDGFFNNRKVKQLVQSEDKFDLVITESFTGQETILIMGHIFKAPTIVLQAFFTNIIVNVHSGNELSLPYIPDTCSSTSDQMSFQERILNSFSILRGLYFYYNDFLPTYDRILKTIFPSSPSLREMIDNVSLTFTNSHVTTDYPQPLTPNIIHVGGIHIADQKPLPQDIQRFMDEAPDGVILFSLGTYVPDNLQPQGYFQMYINVFKRLSQRVLWKTKKDNIEGLPNNVMTVKWAPQLDVLAHPKCVLFITHGGLLSQHEAIHFGVPVIAIPQFFDQYRNARYYEEKRVGIKLDKNDLSEESVSTAIQRVLGQEYRENMRKLSRIFRDRPMSPAESVVFWTEYVLRHRGAAHLTPASIHLSWYQLALLDILTVVLISSILSIICLYMIIRTVSNFLRGSKTKHALSPNKKSS